MSLQNQLLEDMKQAMRDKNTVKLGVIRFLRSEIQNFQIDNGEQDDAGVVKIIASQVKKLKDAITDFQKAQRDDLVEQEMEKVAIMQTYLPAQMSDQELEAIVARVVAASEEKNMGKLIGAVLKEVGDKADGSRVSAAVGRLLR